MSAPVLCRPKRLRARAPADTRPRTRARGHAPVPAYVLVPAFPQSTAAALLVLASWALNGDFCVLAQLEARCFGRTFLGRASAARLALGEDGRVRGALLRAACAPPI